MNLYKYYVSLPDVLIDEVLSYGDVESRLKMNSVIKQLNYYSKEFEYQRHNDMSYLWYRRPKTKYARFAFRQIKNKKKLGNTIEKTKLEHTINMFNKIKL